LSTVESEGLLRALLDTETVPDHVARAILEPAEGNPFFVEEMLAMLVEQGALEERNGGWAGTDRLETVPIPDSIHGVIAARIDLLDARDRNALRRCSVMGRVFWPSAVGVDDDVIAGLGRRAIVAEQVDSSFSGRREFAFKHALTHEVAYATLPRVERRDLHRRVAEWIAESVPDRQAETTEVIAYHYEQALRHGERDEDLERRLFAALRGAGEAAVRRGAYESANVLLDRALQIAPSHVEHASALLVAARVDVAMRRYERAIERLDEIIGLAGQEGDPALRADALGWKARASWLRGSWQDAIDSSQDAVATLEGLAESAELARALARLSQIQMLRALPETAATASRAIHVARRTGEQTAEANARTNLFTARAAAGIMPSTDELGEIVDAALAAGAHDEAARAVINYLWSAAMLGALQPVEIVITDAISRLGPGFAAEGYEQYAQLSLAALVYVPAGRWREADDVLGSTEIAPSVSVRLVWLWLVAGLALRRGEIDVTDRHLPELRTTALASEEPQRILPMVSVAMPRALLAGDTDEASELADIALGLRIQTLSLSGATIPICRVLAATDDHRRLAKWCDVFRGRAAGGQPATVLKVAHGLLELLEGKAALAGRHLLEAEQELSSYGRHYDAACVALDVERALEQAGDTPGAVSARQRARALLDGLGCVNPY
jgi:tetratricopeptide (TPR) repeat protein